jgi:hypothetical protein
MPREEKNFTVYYSQCIMCGARVRVGDFHKCS